MITGASAAAGYFATPLATGRAQDPAQAAPAPQSTQTANPAPATKPAQASRQGPPKGNLPPAEPASKAEKPGGAQEKLTEEQKRQVQDLKSRDTEVRAHESAHSAAGGSYTSAPSFEFTTGPDGKRYATAGEVQIDASPVRGNPKATIRKMDVVIRAATAPADPSSQDMAVARKAQAERNAASSQLLKSPEDGGDGSDGGAAPSPSSDPASASLALTALAAYTDQQKNDDAARTASELANLSIFA